MQILSSSVGAAKQNALVIGRFAGTPQECPGSLLFLALFNIVSSHTPLRHASFALLVKLHRLFEFGPILAMKGAVVVVGEN